MKGEKNVLQADKSDRDYLVPDVEVIEINVWRMFCASYPMSNGEEDDLG